MSPGPSPWFMLTKLSSKVETFYQMLIVDFGAIGILLIICERGTSYLAFFRLRLTLYHGLPCFGNMYGVI
jgi:hypothetical protein